MRLGGTSGGGLLIGHAAGRSHAALGHTLNSVTSRSLLARFRPPDVHRPFDKTERS